MCLTWSRLLLVRILSGEIPPALNAGKAHCSQGHKYDERNTCRDERGRRDCRQCNEKGSAARTRKRAKRTSRRSPEYLRDRDILIRVAQTSDSFTVMDIRGAVSVQVGNLLKATCAEGLIEPIGALQVKASKSKDPVRVWRVTDLGREYRSADVTTEAK